ncbi:nuclear transport factor 2 family protein [Flagellimonas chongwuensis]|nr:nuclear transport factor 2 family protein [Allomuricauda chongwuensis]
MKTMNLPKVITDLITAQDKFDSAAYADCFTEKARVFDEGKDHVGKVEIENWNAETNAKYNTVVKPLNYEEHGKLGILTAESSGTFPGSPIVLRHNFEFEDGLIKSLRITL